KEGKWVENETAINNFPVYDSVRLVELSGATQRDRMRVAAQALRRKQGGTDSLALHQRLIERAETRDAAQIDEVLKAIGAGGLERVLYALNEARTKLNGYGGLTDVRTEIVRLMSEGVVPEGEEKTRYLLEIIQASSKQETLGNSRALAIHA